MSNNYSQYTAQTERPSQATKIVKLVEKYPLFHDQLKQTFICIQKEGHTENWLLSDERFHEFLSYQYFSTYGGAAPKAAISDAIATLKGQARFQGEFRETSLRVAAHEDAYYLDLCNDKWEAVRISKDGWAVEENPHPAFYRSSASSPLPTPVAGGSIDPLWSLINVPEEERLLVLAYLLECLRSNTNYPLLVLEGEQGSAKSTTQRLLKELIDPSAMALRVPPRKIQDVNVAANNDYLLSYNNLSRLQSEMQDTLCCFSTGGTHAERALYTNNQEVVINIQRPIMFNGIGGLVTRQDLIDRAIYLDLPRIRDGQRKTEQDLYKEFENLRPQLLGALLDLMVRTLQQLPYIPKENLPRMADFCLLGRALAQASSLSSSEFDRTYTANQRRGLEKGLESCPIYSALTSFLETRVNGYTGTYRELLNKIKLHRDSEVPGWPQSSKALSTMLKRQAPALRKIGIDVHFDEQRRQEGYYVTVRQTHQ